MALAEFAVLLIASTLSSSLFGGLPPSSPHPSFLVCLGYPLPSLPQVHPHLVTSLRPPNFPLFPGFLRPFLAPGGLCYGGGFPLQGPLPGNPDLPIAVSGAGPQCPPLAAWLWAWHLPDSFLKTPDKSGSHVRLASQIAYKSCNSDSNHWHPPLAWEPLWPGAWALESSKGSTKHPALGPGLPLGALGPRALPEPA